MVSAAVSGSGRPAASRARRTARSGGGGSGSGADPGRRNSAAEPASAWRVLLVPPGQVLAQGGIGGRLDGRPPEPVQHDGGAVPDGDGSPRRGQCRVRVGRTRSRERLDHLLGGPPPATRRRADHRLQSAVGVLERRRRAQCGAQEPDRAVRVVGEQHGGRRHSGEQADDGVAVRSAVPTAHGGSLRRPSLSSADGGRRIGSRTSVPGEADQ